jgi:hypothetical protein
LLIELRRMNDIGKILVISGVILLILGGIFLLAGKVPWIGRLPGDIMIKRGNFSFYFPITTCILASVVLSLIFYMISRR